MAWPLALRAQPAKMPVIGLLSARSREESAHLVAAFQPGLAEQGPSRGRTLLLSIAGPTAITIGFPNRPQNSSAGR